MILSPCLLAIVLSGATEGAANPCTNGSFEELDARGFPADWSPVGAVAESTSDAHSGKRALRMARKAGEAPAETGINRGWRPGDGKQGRMLAQLRGGIDFWYKAVSAQGAKLNVYAIPMNDEPREGTASPRATFTVPAEHVGDGQWHHARLKYDFTGDAKVKWVHFAARIVGTSGELLLDDVAYVRFASVYHQFADTDQFTDVLRRLRDERRRRQAKRKAEEGQTLF